MTAVTDVDVVATSRTHIESLIKAYNKHDVDKILACFAKDVVWEDPSLPEPAVGAAAARDVVVAMLRAFPDLHFLADRLHIFVAPDGKTAIASWTWTATMQGPLDPPGYAPTGKKTELQGTCYYEFKDGLIAHHVVTYDVMGLLRQLGLMPGLDSVGVKAMAGAQRLTYDVTRRVKDVLHR